MNAASCPQRNSDLNTVYSCMGMDGHLKDGRTDSMELRIPNNVKHIINFWSEIKLCFVHFRRFRRIAKHDEFVMSVCASSWNNSAPTRRIFTKLDI